MHSNHTIPVTMAPMHNDLEHVLLTGSLSLIMIASLAGNIMVCITVYKKRRLRTRSNSFIINLAVADLGVVIFCMPFSLMTSLHHVWTLGDVMCQLNGLLNVVFTQTSLLTLTAIAIDKYCAIVWPLKRVMTVRRTLVLLSWTWLQPIVIAVIPFAGLFKYRFKPGTTQCGPEFPRNFKQSIYGIFVCLIGYFIPLGILGYVYTKIFHSAKQSARRISRVSICSSTSTNSLSTHKKVAITVMILVVLFLSCWSPYFVYVIIIISNPSLSTNTHVFALGKASYWMAFLCSALNPYIYGARNPAFRKEFKLLLCCVCPCFARPLKFKGCTIVSSKGSWGRMGPSDDSNDFQRYNFAYAPQDRGGSLNSNGLNEGYCFTHTHTRDASREGTGASNKSSLPQQYGFAYGSHYMGVKRKRSHGGWGHKKFSDSSLSEGNQDDTITDINTTSLCDRRARKASLTLRFEESLNLELPNTAYGHRTSSFNVDQGDKANGITNKNVHQQQNRKASLQLRLEDTDKRPERPSFHQQMSNSYCQQNSQLNTVSKKSSFLERRNRKSVSLQLRFEDNTSLSLESPTSDVPFFNHHEKYSFEERCNRGLRYEDSCLSLESPTSDVPLFEQRRSSFLSDKYVGAALCEDRRDRKSSQFHFGDDYNLDSPISSDIPLFDDRSHSFSNDIDEHEDPYFYKTLFDDHCYGKTRAKSRFEDDLGVGSYEGVKLPQTSPDVAIAQRFRSYSNNIRSYRNSIQEPGAKRNRSHSSYVYYHGEVDHQRNHGNHAMTDQSCRNRSHSNGCHDEVNNNNINRECIDNDEDVRDELSCGPSNHLCYEGSLSNNHASLFEKLTDQSEKAKTQMNCYHDDHNREIASNLVLQQSNLAGCHDEVNNNKTVCNVSSKQTELQTGNHSNTALGDDNNAYCHSIHDNSNTEKAEQRIGCHSNNILSADRVNSTRKNVSRRSSQYKCQWIESTL